MTEFDLIVRRVATNGTLDPSELRHLHAEATFAPASEDVAESVGCIGGSEIALARFVAELCAERTRLEAELRDVIAAEHRPADAASFLSRVADQRGTPPQNVADGLGTMRDWHAVADALERRLTPQRPAQRGGELHAVNA